MQARYYQRGDAIDFTPDRDIAAGEIVRLGALTGVAKLDIKPGELGALALVGVYEMGKVAGVEFTAGEAVNFDPANGVACKTTVAGSFPFGHAVAAAGSADLAVHVRLAQELG